MTATGKLVCIIYSFIGIPLLLIFMTDISEAMTKHVTYIYRYEQHKLISRNIRKTPFVPVAFAAVGAGFVVATTSWHRMRTAGRIRFGQTWWEMSIICRRARSGCHAW